jgi:hypothetical protein
MATNEWITDRLPTEADADGDGGVRVPTQPNAPVSLDLNSYAYQHYTLVVPGQPWWSDEAAARVDVAAPAPAFAVGQQWRRRNGKVVTVTQLDPGTEFPICTDDNYWYRADGASCTGSSQHDLIRMVSSPDPQPAPPAPAPELTRKVVQIATPERSLLVALCNDSTMWALETAGPWHQLPAIPQPEA